MSLLLTGKDDYVETHSAKMWQELEQFRILKGSSLLVDAREIREPPPSVRVRPRDDSRVKKIMDDVVKNTNGGHMILGMVADPPVDHHDKTSFQEHIRRWACILQCGIRI